MSGVQALLIGFGALTGLGAFLLLRAALVVDQPHLADALARLDGRATVPVAPSAQTGDQWARAAGRAGTWAASQLPASALRAPAQALALIGWTPEGYAARKIGSAAFGALFVPLLTTALGAAGVRLPVVVPVAGSLALAGVLFLVVDVVVRDQAAEARGQMRRALCSYLDLVSLRRDASEGPTIALERAAALGDGWVFGRVADALVAARLAGEPPWDGLRRLAADTGVGELADVADIAAVAAQDGASIAPTLRARAQSLRVQLLAEEEAAANTASEKLTAPVALLSIAFLLLFLYPALARLMAS
ncbi:type II secretion system F family protein [Geodermatophilus obscurus]|uniref:Type II secretion system F domain protein n=1 Tax=Geodermatophilus obscurus (strain ATCC 25078 / DSM 43160 / JCM 3152 / CCUG 61914 / KCC A-0152 / KCTC 9177 / NBRC 13315 / NRRL B-3577 / G-20) TaxID=526225 RepID=D2S7F0_GEOOG|nr:type II secretion system F family protein [Geodermatophilus obscurus]ADB73450.1 Type II secretion system F domain protein [Geodermatophilus obscurus DSM 43160]